jgi:predicted lactoylglutathione lyase
MNRVAALLSRRGLLHRLTGGGAVLAAGGLAGCASPAPDAAAPPHTDPTATLGLGITGLIVRDLQAALAFYRRLGIAIPQGVTGDNFRTKLPTGQIFFWDTQSLTRSYDPAWTPSTGSRRVVLEFGFASPEAVDSKYREMVDAGYQSYRPAGDLYGARYAIIVDPDGNQVSLRYPLAS